MYFAFKVSAAIASKQLGEESPNTYPRWNPREFIEDQVAGNPRHG